eukprot:CAMPEP_0118691284 /NCGR_PEP_ID=MMETSP0800-20121206/10591_1 /TAXON_ID=210618 ORGANISM="Striatella unipunctata, Strain CCMP2910" /NCGR_SAMPLE_ID=MMETSP0800 /ASSEMBLY_ACC=CAM_ASM_000638 /LENGTH=563 /DNA_ID=CAMNT_0006589039 /DNA_START=1 /DNA_END=1692 /DNA_ORIENTATION=-
MDNNKDAGLSASLTFNRPQHWMLRELNDGARKKPARLQQYGIYASKYGTARSLRPMGAEYTASTSLFTSAPQAPVDSWAQRHPLQQQAATAPAAFTPVVGSSAPSGAAILHGIQSDLNQPQGLNSAVQGSLRHQFYKLIAMLSASKNNKYDYYDGSRRSNKQFQRQVLLAILIPTLLIATAYSPIAPAILGRTGVTWNRLEKRRLDGRQCVMNFFVDKQEPNEFNPDLELEEPQMNDALDSMDGTHRTRGQLHVISRFIGSVADTFRSGKSHQQQHLVFAGTRDGGNLAAHALNFWPSRGAFKTQLHVMAATDLDENEAGGLDYAALQQMEERFKQNGASTHIHLYDGHGQVAGDGSEMDDDFAQRTAKNNNVEQDQEQLGEVSLRSILVLEEEEDDELLIPYFHVDGKSMSSQLSVLNQAKALLESKSVVVVGMEHSADMDVETLIDFFHSVEYKTFLLGSRQLSRIDNLCPEVLQNVLDHPSISIGGKFSGPFAVFSRYLLESKQRKKSKSPITPPFFVALPKGRRKREEMTIQHMYDLFGGYNGGGQVKTANDRKAPTGK